MWSTPKKRGLEEMLKDEGDSLPPCNKKKSMAEYMLSEFAGI
jgi:hypothetical protein